MSEELEPKKKPVRKKKKAPTKKVQVKETVVTQTPPKELVEEPNYRCLECGNIQSVARCVRCSGQLVRKV